MTIFRHSFNYYALRYFLQWEQVERSLHQEFSLSLTTTSVRNVMHHFRISRSFPGIATQENALLVVRAIKRAKNESAAKNVEDLANQFKKDFTSFNLSAASKLLWCRDRSPYLIFDSRAVKTLKRLGYRFNPRSYEAYEDAWRSAYALHEREIKSAASALVQIHPFCSHWHATSASVLRTSRQTWFKERIFDLALWENGGDG